MKNYLLLSLLIPTFFCHAQEATRDFGAYPLAVPEKNSLMAKWEKKPVFESLLVDDMEHDGRWKATGIGEMSYTQDRAIDGQRSLRFRTSVRDTAYLGLPGSKPERVEIANLFDFRPSGK